MEAKPGVEVHAQQQLHKQRPRRGSRAADWIFVVGVLGGGTLILDQLVKPRVFAVDLKAPSLQLEKKDEIVPTYALGAMALLIPLAVFCVFEFTLLRHARRFFSRLGAFYLGLAEACGFTLVFTNALKLLVGRPRPYFARVCVKYADAAAGVCEGDGSARAARAVEEARKSFPSGHSSLAFAAFLYLALYMALKMRMTAPATGFKAPKFLLLALPPCLAAFVAASRLLDNHHHYADVVAGSLLGAAVAVAVWQCRWQDILPPRSREFDLDAPILPVSSDVSSASNTFTPSNSSYVTPTPPPTYPVN